VGKNKGTFLALSAAVFWASIGLVARFLYGLGADPLFIVSARSVLAALGWFCWAPLAISVTTLS